MNLIQQVVLLLFFSYSFLGFLIGFYKTKFKKNPFGLSLAFNLLGAFVWGDLVVFGVFWMLAAAAAFLLKDFLLFLLTFSSFWFIRSLGETIYWLLEQFSKKTLNKPETLWTSKIFTGSSCWFAMQIFWQCTAVIFLILSIYLIKLWLIR
jgi:hypothetical protein